MVTTNVLDGATVLVTGAGGYIGGLFVERIAASASEVRRLLRRPAPLPRSSARVVDFNGDIRSDETWRAALAGADIVVHFAAQTSARIADADPRADLEINALAPLRLLESCRSLKSRPLVLFAGTVTEAGVTASLPVSEDATDRPITAYDIHKLIAEKYLELFTDIGAVRGATLRLANVYGRAGRGETKEDRGVLDRMIARAAQGLPLPLFGDGGEVRDFIHVDDVVDAFLAAIRHQEAVTGKHFVIGSGTPHTIAEAWQKVADAARRACGRNIEIQRLAPTGASPIERRNFVADSRRFIEATGWSPAISLADGIAREFAASSS